MVLWEGVMDTITDEMHGNSFWVIREPRMLCMEKEPVHTVFCETDPQAPHQKQWDGLHDFCLCGHKEINAPRSITDRYLPPWALRNLFKEIVLKQSDSPDWVYQGFWLIEEGVVFL